MAGIDPHHRRQRLGENHPRRHSQLSVVLRHDASGRNPEALGPWDRATVWTRRLAARVSRALACRPRCRPALLAFNGLDPNGVMDADRDGLDHRLSGSIVSWGLDVTEYTGGNYNCLGVTTPAAPIDLSSAAFPDFQRRVVTLSSTTPRRRSRPRTFRRVSQPRAGHPEQLDLLRQRPVAGLAAAVPGSEMDQLLITNTAERIKLAVTGNLERNGNAFVVLFDTVTGGESPLAGNPSPPGSVNGLNGMTLDAEFLPDYGLAVSQSYGNTFRADLTNLNTNANRLLGVQNFDSHSGELASPGNDLGQRAGSDVRAERRG